MTGDLWRNRLFVIICTCPSGCFGQVENVIKDAGAELGDVTAFAVGIGPGSFTGTRIGVMTIKTLAVVRQKPLYGISSLEAIAAVYQGLEVVLVVPLLPCRAGVVFAGGYNVDEALPIPTVEPAALTIDELAARLGELDRQAYCVMWSGNADASGRLV